eukprot:g2770.t1
MTWSRLSVLLLLCVHGATVVSSQEMGKEGDTKSQEIQSRFMQWLEDRGMPEHNLEIRWFDGPTPGDRYRGLITTEDVKMGDRILRVPQHLLLTSNDQNEGIGELLSKLRETLPKRVIISLKLLYLLGTKDPFWSPFLEFVAGTAKKSIQDGTFEPTSSDTSLLFFSEENLAELQCPSFSSCPILEKLRRVKAELAAVWEAIKDSLEPHFPKQMLTYNNFLWSYVTVSSRAFSINVTASHGFSLMNSNAGEEEKDASPYPHLGGTSTDSGPVLSYIMAPFAGLFNHHNSMPALQFSYGFNDADRTLEVFADQDYSAGDQVYISYGILSNPDTLLSYGFVLPNNVYETVGLSFKLDDPSKLAELTHFGLQEHTRTHVPLTGNPSEEFIAAMRINAHTSPSDHAESASETTSATNTLKEKKNPFLRPLDATSEFEVFQSLLVNVEQLLRAYPTTLRDDLRRLKISNDEDADSSSSSSSSSRTEPLTPRSKLAIMFRVEMKRILHATILQCLRGIAASFRIVETEHRGNATDGRQIAMWEHWDRGMARWNESWTSWTEANDNIWSHTGAKTAREYIDTAYAGAVNDGLESLGLNVSEIRSAGSGQGRTFEEMRQMLLGAMEKSARCELDGSCDADTSPTAGISSESSTSESEISSDIAQSLESLSESDLKVLRARLEEILSD